MNNIEFINEDVAFNLTNSVSISQWVELVVSQQKLILGSITYIFCSDEYLLKINQDHLDHDYYTDIITFDYSENGVVGGDIFISIDRVKENAHDLSLSFNQELLRVLIHGVLHLVGYQDKTDEEQQIMRFEEDKAIALFLSKNPA